MDDWLGSVQNCANFSEQSSSYMVLLALYLIFHIGIGIETMEIYAGKLDECAAAFPGLESGEHKYSFEKLQADLKNSFLSTKQTKIAQDIASGDPSGLIGHAKAAIVCTDAFKQDDRNKAAAREKDRFDADLRTDYQDIERKIAKAVLERNHDWVPVLKLEGQKTVKDGYFIPPLSKKEIALYMSIDRSDSMYAAVRIDKSAEGEYWLMAKARERAARYQFNPRSQPATGSFGALFRPYLLPN